jgi:hypothetical protein
MHSLKTKKDWLDNRDLKVAMAKDCLRVCSSGSCKDPLRETRKAVCGCNSGDNETVIVDSRVLAEEIVRAKHERDSNIITVDEDDLLDVINEERERRRLF